MYVIKLATFVIWTNSLESLQVMKDPNSYLKAFNIDKSLKLEIF